MAPLITVTVYLLIVSECAIGFIVDDLDLPSQPRNGSTNSNSLLQVLQAQLTRMNESQAVLKQQNDRQAQQISNLTAFIPYMERNFIAEINAFKGQDANLTYEVQKLESDVQKLRTKTSGEAVNGGWSDWSAWTGCSVTCNTGMEHRSRTCSNPKPVNGGDYCSGDPVEYQLCQRVVCPVGQETTSAPMPTLHEVSTSKLPLTTSMSSSNNITASATTTISSNSSEPCQDTVDNCALYGKQACTETVYRPWAKAHCSAFCKFCIPVTLTPFVCRDKLDNCKEFDSGDLCTADAYLAWSRENCYAYCGFAPCDRTTPAK